MRYAPDAMRLCRYRIDEQVQYGLTDGRTVRSIGTDVLHTALASTSSSAAPVPLDQVRLLAPVRPRKIIGIGRNYADHAKELGNDVPAEPIIFLKPPSAVNDPDGEVVMPPESQRVDYEGELAVVIGRTGRRIPAARWRDYVFGFTCGNDVTARDLQKKDVQFTRGKSFDTFCPLGPWIVRDLDVSALRIQTRVNGETKQDGTTSDMVFGVAALVEFVSSIMTLEPGDVILTGTPAGVGPVKPGDIMEVEIEGIGVLRNRTVAG